MLKSERLKHIPVPRTGYVWLKTAGKFPVPDPCYQRKPARQQVLAHNVINGWGKRQRGKRQGGARSSGSEGRTGRKGGMENSIWAQEAKEKERGLRYRPVGVVEYPKRIWDGPSYRVSIQIQDVTAIGRGRLWYIRLMCCPEANTKPSGSKQARL